jgi:iron(III) transport system permease protein
MSMLGGTLWIAGGVALASVLIGLPLGILRGMFSLPLPRLWDLLFLIPFLTPPYISALSWMLALQSQGYLQQLTGWHLNDLLFSRSGIVLVMTFNIFPWSTLPSPAACWRADRLAMVARVHGASAWRAFWHVTLPMLSGAGGGDAAGVYPRHRGVWRTGGAGQPGGSGDADGRY